MDVGGSQVVIVSMMVAMIVPVAMIMMVVLPLFLTTGLLARRVPRKLVWLRQRLPELEFLEVPHLGVDPVVVRLLAQRAREAFTRPREGHIGTPFRLVQERCRPALLARA